MSEQVSGVFDTKQIHELTQLNKLNGSEELLIDNGEETLRITVDTLLGYMCGQVGAGGGSTSGGSSSSGGSSGIHIIRVGEPNIPISERIPGHYYIRVLDEEDANLSAGLSKLVKVSPNMRLRLITE